MRPVLLAVSILVASVAVADEVYLPLSSDAGGRLSTTELRITNPSTGSMPVSIELLGTGCGSDTITRQITVAARETIELLDVAALFGMQLSAGVLRITSGTAVRVTGTSRCATCGTAASLPVLEQPVEEGHVASTIRAHPLGWQSSILIVNPGSVESLVILALHRGDDLVEEKPVRVAARGTRIMPMRLLFPPSRLLGAQRGSSGSSEQRQASPDSRESEELISFRSEQPLVLFGYDVNARTGARLFTAPRTEAGQPRRRAVRFTSSAPPEPQTVELTPSKDNTLYQSNNGGRSNGTGVHTFIGTTRFGEIRRALVAFDVASQIPPGSRITSATLTVRVSQTLAGNEPATLHRVTTDWGEGSSNAGASNDGGGDLSEAGDATWVHTFFPDRRWSNPGGDFNPAVDATTLIGSLSHTWQSSAAMVERIQGWLDQPAENFGWLIMGNENDAFTAKRLDSREEDPATRPKLTVEFVR